MRKYSTEVDSRHMMAKLFSVSLGMLFATLLVLAVMPIGNASQTTVETRKGSMNVSASTPQAPIDLGTAGNFAILAKSGITTTGVTAILGDIGVSPIAATAMTGFALILDSSNQFATSTLVTGKVYAADYANPTPSYMITAVSDMELAYAEAAGRINPDYLELASGNLGGLTLVPGLYKWTSTVIIPTDLTLIGNANDVWIFQIAGTLDLGSNAQILLSGGAQAMNVFWQVAGQVSIGTYSVFNGNILAATGISMNTGATLNGRALAQTAVTLIANTINKPNTVPEIPKPDTTAPWVICTSPKNHAKHVDCDNSIKARFSEAMDPLTITTTSFTLKEGKKAVAGVVSYSGVTAVFNPIKALKHRTTYTATITTEVTDLAGNHMIKNYVWTFTTGSCAPHHRWHYYEHHDSDHDDFGQFHRC